MATTKHPGFKAVAAKIQRKEGVSAKSAGAILASATRKSSPAAKAKNPALNRVKTKTGENSAVDKRQDAALRKKTGMTQKQVEHSPSDRRMDAARLRGKTR